MPLRGDFGDVYADGKRRAEMLKTCHRGGMAAGSAGKHRFRLNNRRMTLAAAYIVAQVASHGQLVLGRLAQ